MVQDRRVKGQRHSVRNSQHRFRQNVRFLTYLPRQRVEKYARPTWLAHAWSTRLAHAHVAPRGRCHADFAKRSKTIFSNKTNPKNSEVWCDVVRPSRCNAFAIARFLVEFMKLEKDKRCVASFRNHSVSKANFCTF